MNTSVYDCPILKLPRIGDRNGSITSINNFVEAPFEVNRVFFLYDIPGGESRGAHAHKECHQLIIAVAGSFEVELFDTKDKRTISLNRPNIGLHVLPGIWASEVNFSSSSICLVLASHPYSEEDYIRDINDYQRLYGC